MKNISNHISYKEATFSDTAKRLNISNEPDEKQIYSMQNIATRIFEPLREHFGVPIYISSFYRSSALNKAVGGSITSQHLTGEAIDIDADMFSGITNREIFNYIKDNLDFDQLIDEGISLDGTGGWVHVSFKEVENRHTIFKLRIVDNKKTYEDYN